MVQIVKDKKSKAVTAITALDINGATITLARCFDKHVSHQVTAIRDYGKYSAIHSIEGDEWIFPGSQPDFTLAESADEIVSAFETAGLSTPRISKSLLQTVAKFVAERFAL